MLLALLATPGCSKSSDDAGKEAAEADAANAAQVARYYSTKPVRCYVGGFAFDVPRNYFDPKGLWDTEDESTLDTLSFIAFFPEMGGFTRDNWRGEENYRRQIHVVKLNPVDKNEIRRLQDGTTYRITPSEYGDPGPRFEREVQWTTRRPEWDRHGLQAYQSKSYPPHLTIWTGTRTNGEFTYFNCSGVPDESPEPHRYPICQVQYYSPSEDLFIAYFFGAHLLEHWRQIDEGLWARVNEWKIRQ